MDRKDQFYSMAYDFETLGPLFYAFWKIGVPEFTPLVATAEISYNEYADQVMFRFNPQFWDMLTEKERLFVVAHQAAHIYLSHPARIEDYNFGRLTQNLKQLQEPLYHLAADCAANHFLMRLGLLLDEDMPTIREQAVTVDTLFEENTLKTTLSMERYMDRLALNEEQERQQNNQEMGAVWGLTNKPGAMHAFVRKEEVGRILNALNEELEKENISQQDITAQYKMNDRSQETANLANYTAKYHNPGTDNRTFKLNVAPVRLRIRTPWSKLLRKYDTKAKRSAHHDLEWSEYSYIYKNRRIAGLEDLYGDLFIPSDIDIAEFIKPVRLWLYVDISGSCEKLYPYFTAAVNSIPASFKAKVFAFNHAVHETKKKNGKIILPYGGGTSFDAIWNHVMKARAARDKIDYVWVFTDGYSSLRTGRNPAQDATSEWIWFIDNDNFRRFKKCNSEQFGKIMNLDTFVSE